HHGQAELAQSRRVGQIRDAPRATRGLTGRSQAALCPILRRSPPGHDARRVIHSQNHSRAAWALSRTLRILMRGRTGELFARTMLVGPALARVATSIRPDKAPRSTPRRLFVLPFVSRHTVLRDCSGPQEDREGRRSVTLPSPPL